VLKTVIFSLEVGFTGDFVSDCHTVLKSGKSQGLEKFSCSIRYKQRVSEIYDTGHV